MPEVTDGHRQRARRMFGCDFDAYDLAHLLAKCDWQRTIIDKLPKTADGMPIVPGRTVWVVANYRNGLRIYKFVVYNLSSIGCSDGDRYHWDCHQCYSSREAAEAALDGKVQGKEE